jgi:hypothetical protein
MCLMRNIFKSKRSIKSAEQQTVVERVNLSADQRAMAPKGVRQEDAGVKRKPRVERLAAVVVRLPTRNTRAGCQAGSMIN